MQIDEVNGGYQVQLNLEDGRALKERVFRRLKHIPDDNLGIDQYSAVAGELLKEEFPALAEALVKYGETGVINKEGHDRPEFFHISGMQFGHMPTREDIANSGYETQRADTKKYYYEEVNVDEKYNEREHTTKPQSALSLAIMNLLGFLPAEGHFSVLRNSATGHDDGPKFVIITPVYGLDNIETVVYKENGKQKEQLASIELHRGGVLILSPYTHHEVKNLGEKDREKVRVVESHPVPTHFPTHATLSEGDLAEGRKKFLLPKGVAQVRNT